MIFRDFAFFVVVLFLGRKKRDKIMIAVQFREYAQILSVVSARSLFVRHDARLGFLQIGDVLVTDDMKQHANSP